MISKLARATGVPIDHNSYEQVDRLREMAGRLLRQSPDYQRLLRDLGAGPSPQ